MCETRVWVNGWLYKCVSYVWMKNICIWIVFMFEKSSAVYVYS